VICEHDEAWRPAQPVKKGIRATINAFPEYSPNPLKSVERKRSIEGEEPPPPGWKSPRKVRNVSPMPSVHLNVRNLKASYPSAFIR